MIIRRCKQSRKVPASALSLLSLEIDELVGFGNGAVKGKILNGLGHIMGQAMGAFGQNMASIYPVLAPHWPLRSIA